MPWFLTDVVPFSAGQGTDIICQLGSMFGRRGLILTLQVISDICREYAQINMFNRICKLVSNQLHCLVRSVALKSQIVTTRIWYFDGRLDSSQCYDL